MASYRKSRGEITLDWYINGMAMEMDNIELMVKLQVFTYSHDQRAVHR